MSRGTSNKRFNTWDPFNSAHFMSTQSSDCIRRFFSACCCLDNDNVFDLHRKKTALTIKCLTKHNDNTRTRIYDTIYFVSFFFCWYALYVWVLVSNACIDKCLSKNEWNIVVFFIKCATLFMMVWVRLRWTQSVLVVLEICLYYYLKKVFHNIFLNVLNYAYT